MGDGMTKRTQYFPHADRLGWLRKVPESFHSRARRQQNARAPANHQKRSGEPHGRRLNSLSGQILLSSAPPRVALRLQGALAAKWIAWQAHGCAQLHQRLVPPPRIAAIEQPAGF